jgi:hypothetical protein
VPQELSSEVPLTNEVNRSNSERGLTRRQAIIIGLASIVVAILLGSRSVLRTFALGPYPVIALVFYFVSIILFLVGILFCVLVVIIRGDEK